MIVEARSQVTMLDRELNQTAEAFRGEAARETSEAKGLVATRTESLTKADQRQSLQRLVSPVSGTVNEVSVTTLGQVADAGQPLVTVVPEGEALIVEAFILNRNVGSCGGARVRSSNWRLVPSPATAVWRVLWSIIRPTRS